MRNVRFVINSVPGGEGSIDEMFGQAGYNRLPTRRRQYVSPRGGEGQRYHALVFQTGRHKRGRLVDYEVWLHLDSHSHTAVSSRGLHVIHEEREKVQRVWRRRTSPG